VMLGALSAQLALPIEAWQEALAAGLKPKALPVNLRAFEVGRGIAAG